MTTARSNACLVLGVPTYAWAALRVATRIWINALAFQLPRCPSADCHRFPRCLLFLTMMRKDTETQLSGQNERKLSNASCALIIWPSCQCRTEQQCSKNAKKSNWHTVLILDHWCSEPIFSVNFVHNHPALHIHSMQLVVVKSFGATETRDLAATRQEMHPERKFRSKNLDLGKSYFTPETTSLQVRYLYFTFLPQLGRSSVYWYWYRFILVLKITNHWWQPVCISGKVRHFPDFFQTGCQCTTLNCLAFGSSLDLIFT